MASSKPATHRFLERLHSLVLALVVGCTLTACSEPRDVLLRVGSNVWPGYETLYLAREQGFLDSDRIRLVEYLSATDVMQAFSVGNIEVAALTLDEALTLLADGIDLRIFLVMDISNGADTLVARKDIRTLAELKGKRLAVEETALGAVMLHSMAAATGLDLADIEIVNLDVGAQYQAFVAEKIDAAITFEPESTKMVKAGGHVIFDSSQIPDTIIDVLVVRSDVFESQAELLRTLAGAQFQALEYFKSHPAKAAAIMAKRTGLSPNEFLQAAAGLQYPDRAKNLDLLAGSVPPIAILATQLGNLMLPTKLIAAAPTLTGVFSPAIVEPD